MSELQHEQRRIKSIPVSTARRLMNVISEAKLRSQTEHLGNEDPSRKYEYSDPLKVSDGHVCYCQ